MVLSHSNVIRAEWSWCPHEPPRADRDYRRGPERRGAPWGCWSGRLRDCMSSRRALSCSARPHARGAAQQAGPARSVGRRRPAWAARTAARRSGRPTAPRSGSPRAADERWPGRLFPKKRRPPPISRQPAWSPPDGYSGWANSTDYSGMPDHRAARSAGPPDSALFRYGLRIIGSSPTSTPRARKTAIRRDKSL